MYEWHRRTSAQALGARARRPSQLASAMAAPCAAVSRGDLLDEPARAGAERTSRPTPSCPAAAWYASRERPGAARLPGLPVRLESAQCVCCAGTDALQPMERRRSPRASMVPAEASKRLRTRRAGGAPRLSTQNRHDEPTKGLPPRGKVSGCRKLFCRIPASEQDARASSGQAPRA